MSAIKLIVAHFYGDNRGASLVEYSILIGLIAAATVGSIALVGGYVEGAWGDLETALGLGGG